MQSSLDEPLTPEEESQLFETIHEILTCDIALNDTYPDTLTSQSTTTSSFYSSYPSSTNFGGDYSQNTSIMPCSQSYASNLRTSENGLKNFSDAFGRPAFGNSCDAFSSWCNLHPSTVHQGYFNAQDHNVMDTLEPVPWHQEFMSSSSDFVPEDLSCDKKDKDGSQHCVIDLTEDSSEMDFSKEFSQGDFNNSFGYYDSPRQDPQQYLDSFYATVAGPQQDLSKSHASNNGPHQFLDTFFHSDRGPQELLDTPYQSNKDPQLFLDKPLKNSQQFLDKLPHSNADTQQPFDKLNHSDKDYQQCLDKNSQTGAFQSLARLDKYDVYRDSPSLPSYPNVKIPDEQPFLNLQKTFPTNPVRNYANETADKATNSNPLSKDSNTNVTTALAPIILYPCWPVAAFPLYSVNNNNNNVSSRANDTVSKKYITVRDMIDGMRKKNGKSIQKEEKSTLRSLLEGKTSFRRGKIKQEVEQDPEIDPSTATTVLCLLPVTEDVDPVSPEYPNAPLPVVITDFKEGKVDAKVFKPKHFEMKTLVIGTFRVESKPNESGRLRNKFKIVFSRRNFIYEFEVPLENSSEGNKMICIEVSFLSLVAIKTCGKMIELRVKKQPIMYEGKIKSRPGIVTQTPVYDKKQPIDITCGQIDRQPVHKIYLKRSQSNRLKETLTCFDPWFHALFATPIGEKTITQPLLPNIYCDWKKTCQELKSETKISAATAAKRQRLSK